MDYSTMLCLAELIHEGFLQVLLLFIESTKNVQKFFRILGTLNQLLLILGKRGSIFC